MSTPQLSQQVTELMDREAIRECMARYCRGIDRQDEEALRSAYWPDATDRHGPYQGSASGFIDWALKKLAADSVRSIHHITNMSISFAASRMQAGVETYFIALQRDLDTERVAREVFIGGRYVDRFEKRGDEWRIAARTVVYEWLRPLGTPTLSESELFGSVRQPVGALRHSDPVDPVYALLASLQR